MNDQLHQEKHKQMTGPIVLNPLATRTAIDAALKEAIRADNECHACEIDLSWSTEEGREIYARASQAARQGRASLVRASSLSERALGWKGRVRLAEIVDRNIQKEVTGDLTCREHFLDQERTFSRKLEVRGPILLDLCKAISRHAKTAGLSDLQDNRPEAEYLRALALRAGAAWRTATQAYVVFKKFLDQRNQFETLVGSSLDLDRDKVWAVYSSSKKGWHPEEKRPPRCSPTGNACWDAADLWQAHRDYLSSLKLADDAVGQIVYLTGVPTAV